MFLHCVPKLNNNLLDIYCSITYQVLLMKSLKDNFQSWVVTKVGFGYPSPVLKLVLEPELESGLILKIEWNWN